MQHSQPAHDRSRFHSRNWVRIPWLWFWCRFSTLLAFLRPILWIIHYIRSQADLQHPPENRNVRWGEKRPIPSREVVNLQQRLKCKIYKLRLASLSHWRPSSNSGAAKLRKQSASDSLHTVKQPDCLRQVRHLQPLGRSRASDIYRRRMQQNRSELPRIQQSAGQRMPAADWVLSQEPDRWPVWCRYDSHSERRDSKAYYEEVWNRLQSRRHIWRIEANDYASRRGLDDAAQAGNQHQRKDFVYQEYCLGRNPGGHSWQQQLRSFQSTSNSWSQGQEYGHYHWLVRSQSWLPLELNTSSESIPCSLQPGNQPINGRKLHSYRHVDKRQLVILLRSTAWPVC